MKKRLGIFYLRVLFDDGTAMMAYYHRNLVIESITVVRILTNQVTMQ